MDKNGYPENHELNTIENWNIRHKYIEDLFNYINLHWMFSNIPAYWQVTKIKKGIKYEISTGGWSGNESIIAALKKNIIWNQIWQDSRKDGHHIFIISTNQTLITLKKEKIVKQFEDLKGSILKTISGKVGDDEMIFTLDNDEQYKLYYEHD